MRSASVLLLFAAAACAASGAPDSGPRQTSERRTTTVTYTAPDGRPVNINLESNSVMETRSYPIPAAPQAIWAALPLAYQDLGIPLAAYDSVQLYIGNPGMAISGNRLGGQRISRFLNCGMDGMLGALADRYDVRLNVVSRVRADGDDGILETQVAGEAAQRGTAGAAVPCSSTGQLEDALANATKLRLSGGHPPR